MQYCDLIAKLQDCDLCCHLTLMFSGGRLFGTAFCFFVGDMKALAMKLVITPKMPMPNIIVAMPTSRPPMRKMRATRNKRNRRKKRSAGIEGMLPRKSMTSRPSRSVTARSASQ